MQAGIKPSMTDALTRAARVVDPDAVVWGGDWALPPSQQGLKVLGVPIGHPSCRGIISYTSYSRTNDCIYNGYDNINLEFAKSGHPIFRATTPLSRGKLKSKGKGKVSIHFSAEPDTD